MGENFPKQGLVFTSSSLQPSEEKVEVPLFSHKNLRKYLNQFQGVLKVWCLEFLGQVRLTHVELTS